MEPVTGPAYKPQTTAGEVAHTLGEFAPNALAGGGGGAALRAGETVAQTASRVAARRADLLGGGTLGHVVAPALVSEGAGRVARDVAPDYEPAARFAGALAGGIGAAVAQAPRGAAAVREGLEGFSAEQLGAAQALRDEARALPGGGINLPLDEALNQVTGGQAGRLSQISRVVANSGGEGGRIANKVYSERPAQVEATGRAAFDGMVEKAASPTELGGAIQDAARAGMARTPEGLALTEARVAAGPRVTPEQAGQVIQPELRRIYDRREGMRAALADPEYTAAREAPETVGIERSIEVERPGEPIVTQPAFSRPQFEAGAPRPTKAFERPSVIGDDPNGVSLARFKMPPERAPLAIDEGPSAGRAFNEVATSEARTAYEGHLSTSPLDAATVAVTGEISGKKLRSALRANEDQLAQFPAVRDRLMNVAVARDGMTAVERSPLGQVAQKPKVKHAVGVLFNRDRLAGGEAEIGAAMGSLAKSDPTSARQLARIHLETVFDDAVAETRGLPAQYGGAGFASAVAGNPQQRKNLEAAIKALPEGDTLWAGLDRFLTVLRTTGYRPQKGGDTAFNARIQEEMKGGGGVRGAVANVVTGAAAGGSAVGVGGAAGGGLLGLKRSASDAWTRCQIGRNGEAVARMLFDPKALPDLRHLVQSKPGSKNADFFTSRLMALAAGSSAPGERGAGPVP
ncbi:hypothetical protein ASF32_21560 [Methylobacterium sp. Leaf91]|nr:hypothetical protein ASF32_21560 [Methylobacterium sp. Leaf91]